MDTKRMVLESMEEMKRDLGRLVAYRSVCDMDTAGEGKPFGQGAADALEAVLAMAGEMGMETRNFGGYAGDITVGQGKTMIGILCHVDVVDVSDGWDTPPFEMTEKDGKLYGRGTSDDKGPLVSCLYAMRYLRDQGRIPATHSIRMIVGADEEEEYRCMNYYVKHADRLPDCAFIPDAYFPLVYAEKGLIDFDLEFPLKKDCPETACPGAAASPGTEEGRRAEEGVQTETYLRTEAYPRAEVLSLSGGSARNIVAPEAVCRIAVSPEEKEKVCRLLCAVPELTVSEIHEPEDAALPPRAVLEIRTVGVACHAMSPEKGKNAVNSLLCGLAASGIQFSIQPFLEAFDRMFGLTYDGSRMGCQMEDETSGALTLNVGTVLLEEGRVSVKANVRYPVSADYEQIEARMIRPLKEAGFRYREILAMDPLYMQKDGAVAEALMAAYQEVTGDREHEPFAIGGATYARLLPNAVSFGPLFPWETELAHEDNECVSVESLGKMTEIYLNALDRLMR